MKKVCIVLMLFTWLCLFIISCNNRTIKDSTANTSYLQFPDTLSSFTPYDVDIDLENELLKSGKLPEAQRIFEILSWQMFISLNWPLDSSGKPMPDISNEGKRIWEHWKESFEIFKEDGSRPLVWGASEMPDELKDEALNDPGVAILYRTSEFSSLIGKKGKIVGKRKLFADTADEINQAFTSPIWDQNGNIVRYEIRLNKQTTDYIVENELYNIDGQIAFSKAGKKVSFPAGTRDSAGSVELKFAWRIIDTAKDFPERYFTREAYVLKKDGSFEKKIVGLIGMHIGTKTKSSPQWIWATFEHVDNLETNTLEMIHGKRLKPSFYDPDCSTCPVNLIPDTNKAFIKNQIQRVLPVPRPTQALNKQVQSLLHSKNTVFQYYELIGTQWPTIPGAPAYPSDTNIFKLPEAVINKSGGFPVPVYLTNMVMETYFQGGTTVGSTPATTFYNQYLANEPAFFQMEGFPKTKDTANTLRIIFGTEGCVGCHHSAGIALGDTIEGGLRKAWYGKPGSADFEWLLQLKAHFKK